MTCAKTADLLPLPRGVTGLRSASDPPLPTISRADALAGALPMLVGGGAVAVAPPDPGSVHTSFHDVQARWRGRSEPVRLLCHRVHPWIAFARLPNGSSLEIAFVPPPAGITQPLEPFLLVPLSLLERPVEPSAIAQLAPAELEQVAYWRPARLGDVIFQYWD
jgi:hypothetical protein